MRCRVWSHTIVARDPIERVAQRYGCLIRCIVRTKEAEGSRIATHARSYCTDAERVDGHQRPRGAARAVDLLDDLSVRDPAVDKRQLAVRGVVPVEVHGLPDASGEGVVRYVNIVADHGAWVTLCTRRLGRTIHRDAGAGTPDGSPRSPVDGRPRGRRPRPGPLGVYGFARPHGGDATDTRERSRP